MHFECVVTDVDEAAEVWLDRGSLVDAILASSAIPSVYPSVVIDGVRYRDGAIVNDIPISRAVDYGATTRSTCSMSARSTGRGSNRNARSTSRSRRIGSHAGIASSVIVHALPPHRSMPCSFRPASRRGLPFNDFTHSDELMDERVPGKHRAARRAWQRRRVACRDVRTAVRVVLRLGSARDGAGP